MACAVLLPCACFVAWNSNLNAFFHRDCKLPPSYIKKYMQWQVIYYPLQLPFDFIESIAMHVIFYQCSSQPCPLAYHFNITIINISASYIAYISWAAPKIYYSWYMLYSGKSASTSSSSSSSCNLSCSMSMMQNCPCKNNVVDFSVSWSSMWFLSMRRLFPIFRMCILHLLTDSSLALLNWTFPRLRAQRHVCLDIVGDAICVSPHHVPDRYPYAARHPGGVK